ncbi:helix-turn-helix transcriptional regulator [Cytobacillus praedii]|uniref:helix-turn-helix domain-containing protein n=1 Tax=Cytobacillus praedii TaxID=1742358 RepID=UPI002E24E867|nr:helix-turn-helix transcriptional regulator [Cytobacillus praedii]
MFSERLKKMRILKSMTQENVANYLGMTRQGYGHYERSNMKHEPDLDTIKKLADLFNVTTDYLLGRSDIPFHTAKQDKELSEETMYYLHILETIPKNERKLFEQKIIEYAEFLRSKQEN